MKHQTSKGDQMQASKCGWKSLVITHQAARQEHKAPFGETSLIVTHI